MIQQDFTDAFILWLSGAADMKNEREMWWDFDFIGKATIEFPDNSPKSFIVRQQWGSSRRWEVDCRNGLIEGNVWWSNGDVQWWTNDRLDSYERWRNGKRIDDKPK